MLRRWDQAPLLKLNEIVVVEIAEQPFSPIWHFSFSLGITPQFQESLIKLIFRQSRKSFSDDYYLLYLYFEVQSQGSRISPEIELKQTWEARITKVWTLYPFQALNLSKSLDKYEYCRATQTIYFKAVKFAGTFFSEPNQAFINFKSPLSDGEFLLETIISLESR